MRFQSIGLGLVATASITSAARQCRLQGGGSVVTALPSTDLAATSTIEVSTKGATETAETSAEASSHTSPALSISESTAISTRITESTATSVDLTESTTTSVSVIESTTVAPSDISTTAQLDDTTTSAPLSIQVSTESSTTQPTEAPTTTSLAATPLTTFALTAGNIPNSAADGKGIFAYKDGSYLYVNPSATDAAMWNIGTFSLESGTNFLKVGNFYVALSSGGTINSFTAAKMTLLVPNYASYIKCNDAYANEALSCFVVGSPSKKQFIIYSAQTSGTLGIETPNTANTPISLIAGSA